jgi:outer membrane protein TolC
METMYASAQADLNKAQANYRVAQVNLQAGNVTKTTVEQAEMGVISAQNALNEIVHNYNMLVYTFENPTLLSNAAGAAQ